MRRPRRIKGNILRLVSFRIHWRLGRLCSSQRISRSRSADTHWSSSETGKTAGTLVSNGVSICARPSWGNFALSGSQVAIAASTVFSSLDCITRLPFWLLSLPDYRPEILTGGCLALFSQIAASRRLVAPNPPGGSRRVSGGAAENKGKLGSLSPRLSPLQEPQTPDRWPCGRRC